VHPDVLATAPAAVRERLERLAACGLLTEGVDEVAGRLTFVGDLGAAVADVFYVQECIAESLQAKRELVGRLADLLDPSTIVASSSSAIPMSAVAGGLPGRERCLVAHPANPPYLLPVVEVVPAPFTSARAVEAALHLLRHSGMRPVVLKSEVEGFVMNRLQGALLREAYCLVRDGIVSVDDLDAVVRDGIGRRWAFSGPFETADLNTVGGVRAHAERLGQAYWRMGAERGQDDPWTDDLVDEVTAQRRELMPLADWHSRTMWREERLMDLAALMSRIQRPSQQSQVPSSSAKV
jgi:3-hydroxyacyl-CoA dehydrogenase